jgi:hypothetical protein
VLWVFVAAKAPEAVARMMANPKAVLLNMVFVSWLSRAKLLWLSLFG